MGNEESCKHYGPQEMHVDVTPPTLPQDTVTAYRTLVRSGDHKRRDAHCPDPEDTQAQPSSSFWQQLSGYKEKEDLDCSGIYVKPPQLEKLRIQDVEAAYLDYTERLRKTHEKESRHTHDKYTKNLEKVEERFRANEKEPLSAELESVLYTSLRTNRAQPLDSYDDCQNYMHSVKKNASLCFRLAPESKRKQKSCPVEFVIPRETPRDDTKPIEDSFDEEPVMELPELDTPNVDKYFQLPTLGTDADKES